MMTMAQYCYVARYYADAALADDDAAVAPAADGDDDDEGAGGVADDIHVDGSIVICL